MAVSFICKYPVYLTMQGLFCLADESMVIFQGTFSTSVNDFVTLLGQKFDALIDAIESGILPEIDGLEKTRDCLQVRHPPLSLMPSSADFGSVAYHRCT